ncbi:hypothetical protein N24_1912 [Corynebacterium suranareeae]|uniref:Secreted protein n=1 Tax=Corynebacterium suranareeae TaxID=2506452 RepID=A0A160PRD8_9CORY|nr:hypothetical protein [Corynebacterium suranareeae]BAU96174.1 hypothetical protein N24_1912 [Corynebacterium suranareeae]
MLHTPRTHRALGLAALTASALLLSSCSTTTDLLNTDPVAQTVTDAGGSALNPTAAHVLTITNATAMTLGELPEHTDAASDADTTESTTMAQSALKRIYGLEISADGTLIAVAAPLTSRNSSSEQPTPAALADPENNTELTTAHILELDPTTGTATPRQDVALPEDFQTMAGSFSQIRNGWGITQLIGQDPDNRKESIRSADTWTVTGSTNLTGFNTDATADSDVAAYTMPATDPAVGICALESHSDAPLDEHRDLSASALRTASVLSSSGSATLKLHDPMVMATTSTIQARAYVDGEVINQHEIGDLREQLGINIEESESNQAESDAQAAADHPLAALGLSNPTSSALVPGLAELDCLSADQAATWHNRDASIGTGKPGVIAVINAEMADDYAMQLLSSGATTAETQLAQLPDETAFVLIDPSSGAVTDLFFIQSLNTDLPAPASQINSIAVDQRDPNIIYATFADDDHLYQMLLG